jgi:hypothetical protein
MLLLLAAATMTLAGTGRLTALPRFSLLTGTRCSACHFNPQGSGIRNELGWSTMNRVGLISPESVGLDSLFASDETNSYFDGLVTFGLDTRFQIAKLGRPPDAKRKFIPMQVAPSIAVAPFEWLTGYATYNFGTARYPGQTNFDAALLVQPSITAPALRLGYMQPSIGIRHDDHTMFVRRDAAGLGTPLIPPNYNELGAEINYEGLRWLTVNAGAYSSHNIAGKTELLIDSTKPMFLGRVVLWPQLLDEGLNGMVGGSFFGNQDFRMLNGFAGIGLADKATVYGEGSFFKNADGKIIRNMMIQSTYQLAQWMNLEWRYEWGLSEHPSTGPFYAHSFVIGSEFFLFPYIELRPEYRYTETSDYTLGQYTLQIHAFY